MTGLSESSIFFTESSEQVFNTYTINLSKLYLCKDYYFYIKVNENSKFIQKISNLLRIIQEKLTTRLNANFFNSLYTSNRIFTKGKH